MIIGVDVLVPERHDRAVQAPRLVMLDDSFPDLRSGFRLAELGAYLDRFPGSIVAVGPQASAERLEAALREYRALRPDHDGRTVPLAGGLALTSRDFLYAIFLNNASAMLAWAEGHRIPFAFQLYPGGGFAFDDAESDAKLQRLLDSAMFSFVVVTQPAMRDYVEGRFGVGADRLHLIGPGPVWSAPDAWTSPREHFGQGKASFDVGFVAHKYGDDLRTKGFDFFVEVARRLSGTCEHARFHVVGNYAPGDASLDGFEDRVTFHGLLDAPELDRVCRRLDVVVSPNIPTPDRPGHVDGFPTASCSQAALAGAVGFLTRPTGLDTTLVPGRDFLLLERDRRETRVADVERAAETLRDLAANPPRLAELSTRGRAAFHALVGPEAQIAPRVELIRRALAGAPAPADANGRVEQEERNMADAEAKGHVQQNSEPHST